MLTYLPLIVFLGAAVFDSVGVAPGRPVLLHFVAQFLGLDGVVHRQVLDGGKTAGHLGALRVGISTGFQWFRCLIASISQTREMNFSSLELIKMLTMYSPTIISGRVMSELPWKQWQTRFIPMSSRTRAFLTSTTREICSSAGHFMYMTTARQIVIQQELQHCRVRRGWSLRGVRKIAAIAQLMKDRFDSTSMMSSLARLEEMAAFSRNSSILGRSTQWFEMITYRPQYRVTSGSTTQTPTGYQLSMATGALLLILSFAIVQTVGLFILFCKLYKPTSCMSFRVKQSKELKITNPRAKDAGLRNGASITASFDEKLGVTRVKQIGSASLPECIKPHSSLSLDKTTSPTDSPFKKASLSPVKNSSTTKKEGKLKQLFKLPQIQKNYSQLNPEEKAPGLFSPPEEYYQSKVYRAFKNRENTYMMNLARQHFLQSVEAIRVGKGIKLPQPKELKLARKNMTFKTIYLDLDETLIHCDETSTNYTVKLKFPIEGGGTILAGIRIRPFCAEFLKELASFAEIIIFTASAQSYADVILDYLDPNKEFISHRLYRNNCTLERGFYTKDLRIVNRKLEEVAIVDNSAFTFMTQPEHGIPILPFYHFAKDRELLHLLEYLRKLVLEKDLREKIKADFFWHAYKKSEDPRRILLNHYQKPMDGTA